jgi:hypothetical protein
MVTLKRSLLASVATILSASCAQAPAPDDAALLETAAVEQQESEDAPVISDHPMCERAVRLIVNPLVARPGATLKIFSDHPLGYAPPLDVPDELLTRWRASPAGAAAFSADGTQVTVAESAAPGTILTLSALYCGKEEVTKTVPIVGKDEPVIVGFWKQESADCTYMASRHDPIKELVFEAGGGFSVTYTPFESYRDYWGAYRFDHRTGALEMTVSGGNRKPLGPDLSGTAKLENEKRLVLEDVYLGPSGHPDARCKYVFVK